MEKFTEADELLRFFGRQSARYNTAAYLVSGNPYFAWKVYQGCRDSGQQLPEWLLRYFDTVAQGLSEGRDGRKALGVQRAGGGRQPAAMQPIDRDRLDTYQRYLRLENNGMTENERIDQIAADKETDQKKVIEQKTIRNHLKHVRRLLESNSAS